MSDLENFLKYILAISEHGSIKFVTVKSEISNAELETLISSYPFLLDDKYGLICSPYPNPTNCRLESPDMGISCEKPLFAKKVTCYNTVTGELYSATDSAKIFEMLSKAHKTCALRFTLDVKKKFATPKVSSVPPQANPVPQKTEVKKEAENDVDKLFAIINDLKAKYGTPSTTPPPTAPKKTVPVEKEFKECFELANEFGFPEMKQAIESKDKDKALAILSSISSSIIQSDRALLDYKKYSTKIRKCQHKLEEL